MLRATVVVLSAVLCIGVGLAWGVAMTRAHVFPYQQLRALSTLRTDDVRLEAPGGYRERVELFAAFGRTADVVMLGDSHTSLLEWREALPRRAIINRGIAGDSVSGVHARVAGVLQLAPRVVVVMIGINDIRNGRRAAPVAADYRRLIDALLAPAGQSQRKPRLVVVSTLPVASSDGVAVAGVAETNRRVAAVNADIAKYAVERGQTFLDLAKILAPDGTMPEALTTDGLHLAAPAYATWITMLGPALGEP